MRLATAYTRSRSRASPTCLPHAAAGSSRSKRRFLLVRLFPSRIPNSADQSESARHRPSILGCPASSNSSMAAISARHRSTSRRRCSSCSGNLAVASPITIQVRLSPGERLPPRHGYIAIRGIEFNEPSVASRLLTRDHRCSGTTEGIQDRVARLTAVSNQNQTTTCP